MDLDGWHPDPFGIHEARLFTQGKPTALVKDDGIGSLDAPPITERHVEGAADSRATSRRGCSCGNDVRGRRWHTSGSHVLRPRHAEAPTPPQYRSIGKPSRFHKTSVAPRSPTVHRWPFRDARGRQVSNQGLAGNRLGTDGAGNPGRGVWDRWIWRDDPKRSEDDDVQSTCTRPSSTATPRDADRT